MVWDENRDYGREYEFEMGEMVKRDRNHPSIVVWSYCNEFECEQLNNAEQTAFGFRKATLALDTSRPLSANNNGADTQFGVDVQGFSHKSNASCESFHHDHPQVPVVLSECCSCVTQRVAAPGNTYDSATGADRRISPCEPEQNSPGLLPYVSGSLGVWTLFDYFGEPNGRGGWPKVSCSFGQLDIAGFPKPHAWWYIINWASLPTSQTHDPQPGQGVNGVPLLAKKPVARILDLLDFPLSPSSPDGFDRGGAIEISAVVSTESAELLLDGKSLGVRAAAPLSQTSTDSGSVTWRLNSTAATAAAKAGATMTLKALDDGGSVVAEHTIRKPGAPAAVRLQVDVPSAATGTGSKLLLDGRDTALIRAEVVDAEGVLCTTDTSRLSFRVLEGPGRVRGTSNGDSTSHEKMGSSSIAAFGGLARVLVQVNADCTPGAELGATIDTDGGVTTAVPNATHCATLAAAPIVVGVTMGGGGEEAVFTSQMDVPVSTAAEDSAMNVARASAQQPLDFSYLRDFQG